MVLADLVFAAVIERKSQTRAGSKVEAPEAVAGTAFAQLGRDLAVIGGDHPQALCVQASR